MAAAERGRDVGRYKINNMSSCYRVVFVSTIRQSVSEEIRPYHSIRPHLLLLYWTILLLSLPATAATSLHIPDDHSLHHALHQFDILHLNQITHHTPSLSTSSTSSSTSKTSSSSSSSSSSTSSHYSYSRDTIQVHFRTLNKDFNLILTPSLPSVQSSLVVTVVTAEGAQNRRAPHANIYNGHLLGSPDSHVTAQLHPLSGVLTATVHSTNEVYYIEPLSRHFLGSHDSHMITYKHSHLKFNLTGEPDRHFCGNHHNKLPWKPEFPWKQPLNPTNYFLSSKEYGNQKQRLKRNLAGDVCTLHLVATPSFHSQTSTDPDTTILFLLGLIGDIDFSIYQAANFTSTRSKLGLVVTNITIYTSESGDSIPQYARDKERNSESLLKQFSEDDWSGVCLAHLFTAIDFTDSRLGVAYVASRNQDDTGGICSPVVSGNGGRMETANVGVSTFRNSANRPLLLAEARLVTAHEIGHGWGSEHDPEGVRACSPPLGRNQGKYLMFPSATDGDQQNNDMFSPCSVAMISDVVRRKGNCFKDRSQLQGRCGNYIIDDDEDCDAGALGLVNSDPCCTPDCHLRTLTPDGKRVQCSDVNHECCENCQIADPMENEKVCQTHREGNRDCLRSVFCMGEKICPKDQDLTFELRYVDENTTCGQLGRCLPPDSKCYADGSCITKNDSESLSCYNFCQWHGLEECFCTGSDECRFCCLQSDPGTGNRTCKPFSTTLRPDHSSCIGGFCQNGMCVPATQDLIQRLFVLFDNPSLNTLVQFMRENIVGTVILLTAILWVPASFLIHIFDVYRWRRHKRVAREYEATLQDAELEDEDDLYLYDNVFDELEQSQPGVFRPEARIGLMRLDSGTMDDCFGTDNLAPLTPRVPVTPAAPYSGLWENRLSTITEESSSVLNPDRENILLYKMNRPSNLFGSGSMGSGGMGSSSYDSEHGTLV